MRKTPVPASGIGSNGESNGGDIGRTPQKMPFLRISRVFRQFDPETVACMYFRKS
jgi:hypothetical protein